MSTDATMLAAPAKVRVEDWDDWMVMEIEAEMEGEDEEDCEYENYLDQSDGLLKYDDVHFGKISPYFTFLTGEDNFDAWLNAVTECLSSHGLMGLISESSPRPLFLNNESRNWVRLSTKTARWMQSSMNRALRIRLEGMGERCTYADAVMRSAKLLVQGTKSQADAKRIKEFVQLKPTDFDLPVK
ncbi:uncharacterized protein N7484_004796 [Penicillium longicatenatum]|uniref:uncharacterized protein n=1 Tax=Penicillium longicatenatum TaxID=1561947 RepID=UPI002546CE97|nr:uncharacterized protein N7484_004796 [Penicillium longicatenatum]KAJ5651073.1 hypothetical protein N7484_004796 [Penicillium longicatenatum]